MDNSYKKIIPHLSCQEKQDLWDIAVGLNKVDNLTQSEEFYKLAKEQVEGKKTYEEVRKNLHVYYQKNSAAPEKEADLAATRMTEFLAAGGGMSLNTGYFKSIHKFLFQDWEENKEYIGQFRDYNIHKAERILNGDSIDYVDYSSLEETLTFDFEQERKYTYKDITKDNFIKHIATFTSHIWQVHPFIEGNTRTTAIFIIKYLQQKRIKTDNTIFKNNSQYFRDALVAANSVNENYAYLYAFFEQVLSLNADIIFDEIPVMSNEIGFKF